MAVPADVVSVASPARRVLVLTGAGMSAESGLATFRDEHTGLWSRFRPEDLATPEAWRADRELVWAWYQWRVAQVRSAVPNAGHRALVRLAEEREVVIVTQNVDDLHERAGSVGVRHLHGSLFAPRCDGCGRPAALPDPPGEPVERLAPPSCAACPGSVRPGVVWFGEMPEGIDEAIELASGSDLVLVIGTSGVVYPAATIAPAAATAGVPVVEINPRPSGAVPWVPWPATAAGALPALVDALDS